DTVPLGRVHGAMSHGYHRSLFSTTVATALRDRAIAYDDTARDFLDNMELKRVLMEVKAQTGRKIDLVGFDACLMNMLELAYELRETADFIVGSEESEPGDGWPYDTVLADLVARPGMSAQELGATIVKRYVESYPSESVTQSLLDLRQAPQVTEAVDALASVLLTVIKNPMGFVAVHRAIKATQAYAIRDFVDLGDLLKQLLKQLKSVSPALEQHTLELLKKGPESLRAFVAAEGHKGQTVARSTGVTIYCPTPRSQVSVVYERLAFAGKTRWDDFIHAYA
ncbi:MAG TPA: clostripain-related cysteine peptidase, partial [Archangium sp.]|uniref:clostripain-related cysteine peptidase n=1 Tax=Archangium sp. TaxID=1872627 RepID=UPI002E2F1BBC